MGIRGIYGEIGPGDRVALSRLASEHFEEHGRPLRIAIDISIWQFQIQSGKGGTNPALRTLYYRLLRLLSHSIHPLFVFDGPHKPLFKRNRHVGSNTACLPNLLAKELLKLFGFPFHIAPGEAEAECALLQRQGVVDCVLSEDVDTLMFGCGITLRNWSSEGTRGNKAPTHVSKYVAAETRNGPSGLDREGMILVALMSGGDYITEGIPGAGIKVACDAARAGFGRSLCALARDDDTGFTEWRELLCHELRTNESRFFKIKRKSLKIPKDFPNRQVLKYYTNPAVSSAENVDRLSTEISWETEPNIWKLREFVADAFDWRCISGAKKFVRGLAPALLTSKLRTLGLSSPDISREKELIREICGGRTHFSTDGMREIRVSIIPLEVVQIDLSLEEPDESYSSDEGKEPVAAEQERDDESESNQPSQNPPKPRAPSTYDPSKSEKVWLPETYLKAGIPLTFHLWEKAQLAAKAKPKTRPTRKEAGSGGMKPGALDRFVKVSKPGITAAPPPASLDEAEEKEQKGTGHNDAQEVVVSGAGPPARMTKNTTRRKNRTLIPHPPADQLHDVGAPSRSSQKPSLKKKEAGPESVPPTAHNPWSLSRRPSHKNNITLLKGSIRSELGIFGLERDTLNGKNGVFDGKTLKENNGPFTPADSTHAQQKHYRSPSPSPIRTTSSGPRTPSTAKPDVDHVGLRTPSSNGKDLPSPRKKRTPNSTKNSREGDKMTAAEVAPAVFERLQSSFGECLVDFDHSSFDRSHRLNRKLSFNSTLSTGQPKLAAIPPAPPKLATLTQPAKSISTLRLNPLPSPVTITSSPPHPTPPVRITEIRKPQRRNQMKNFREMVALRSSLEGAWKEIDGDEVNPSASVFNA